MAEASVPDAARPGGHTAAPAARAGTFASLRVRNFRLLLLGSTLSNLAQWIQQVTISWLVYDLTGSGAMLGLVNLARSAATVGLAPVSGVIIDRIERRTLLLWTAAWLMIMSFLLGVILLAGHQAVWYLFAFAFLGGLAAASLGRGDRRGVLRLGALVLLSLSLIGFAMSTVLALAAPLLVLAGLFEMIYLTSNQTLLQLSIPDDMRGRMTSLTTLNMGLSPLGAVYAGWGADLVGPTTVTIVLSATAIAVATLVLSPTVRDYRISHALRSQSCDE